MDKSFLRILLGALIGIIFPQEVTMAKNPYPPPGWENRTGDVIDRGMRGFDSYETPHLVGKPAEPQAIYRFLKRTGFFMIIRKYEASQTIPEGTIISQSPAPSTIVKSPGAIKTVVSTGKNPVCADILNKQAEQRIKYEKLRRDTEYGCDDLLKSMRSSTNQEP